MSWHASFESLDMLMLSPERFDLGEWRGKLVLHEIDLAQLQQIALVQFQDAADHGSHHTAVAPSA